MSFIVGIISLIAFILGVLPIVEGIKLKSFDDKVRLLTGALLASCSSVMMYTNAAMFSATLVSLWGLAAMIVAFVVLVITLTNFNPFKVKV